MSGLGRIVAVTISNDKKQGNKKQNWSRLSSSVVWLYNIVYQARRGWGQYNFFGK